VAHEEAGDRLGAGSCSEGGELVMLCDLTIAADSAAFGEPEIRFSAVGPAIVMPMIIGCSISVIRLMRGSHSTWA
jgi:enoyl-CoA hydratase/carnithine racemase